MRIRFPVVLSTTVCVTVSAVLSSYIGVPFKCLEEYVGFPHSTFLELPESVRMRYAFRRRLQDRVSIGSRHYNLTSGCGVDRILSCGGWLG